MKKLLLFTCLLFSIACGIQAQVAINTTGNAPASSAMLDVNSTNKGVLISRMTSAERKAIANPAPGLLVFDTDRQTIYFFEGAKWKAMMTATESLLPLVSRSPEGPTTSSRFGHSLDIYNNTAVIGAPWETGNGIQGGAVHIYEKEGGVWKFKAKVSAPTPGGGENFGTSVSLYNDLLIVGAPDRSVSGQVGRGIAYVFQKQQYAWNFITTLQPSNGLAGDKFGTCVTTNGTYVAVGSPYRDHGGKTDAGSAYIFGMQNGAWAQKAIVSASDPMDDAEFGLSADIWQSRLIVGAPGITDEGKPDVGAAYIFNNVDAAGFTWPFAQRLQPGYLKEDSRFGTSVAIEGDKLVCGIPGFIEFMVPQGRVVSYKYVNNFWYGGIHIQPHEIETEMGTSVAIADGVIIGGAPGFTNKRGKVTLNGPQVYKTVYDDDPNMYNKFGIAVAAHNGQFIVSSINNSHIGRVYFGMIED